MTPRSAQRDAYLLERQASARRTEHQVRERGGADANREPCDDARRQRHPERDARQARRRAARPADPGQRPGHVRRRRHHDGRDDREPHRGIARRRGRRRDPAEAVGARAPPRRQTPPPRTGRSSRRRGARRRASVCACGRRSGWRSARPPRRTARRTRSPRTTRTDPGSEARNCCVVRSSCPGPGATIVIRPITISGERDEHDVGRPPCSRCIARRGEDADVGVAERPEQRTAGLRGTAVGVLGASPGARWRSSIDPSLDAQSARSEGRPRDLDPAADGMMGRRT